MHRHQPVGHGDTAAVYCGCAGSAGAHRHRPSPHPYDDTGSFYIVGDPDPIFTPTTVTQADNPWAVPGDWDGDTWTEPAVVSAETGVWETPDGTFTYAPADLVH